MGYIPTGTERIQLLPTPWFCLHHWYCSEFTHIPVFVRTAVGKHCTDPHTWLVATSELWYLIHMITLAGLFSTSPSLLVFESVLLLTKIWYTANPTFARKVVVERGGSGLAKVKFLALPPPLPPTEFVHNISGNTCNRICSKFVDILLPGSGSPQDDSNILHGSEANWAKVKFLASPPPLPRICTQHFWEYMQHKICRYITW